MVSVYAERAMRKFSCSVNTCIFPSVVSSLKTWFRRFGLGLEDLDLEDVNC